MAINIGAIGKRVGKAAKAGADELTGSGNGDGNGASTGRKVGSMLRRGIGKLRTKRKNGDKPTFKYSGKTMSA